MPHFQITQIPEDGVNQLLQRKKKAESGEPEETAPRAQPQPATTTSSWKPYHNATVAVSSVLKRSNQPPIMPEEDFYHQQQQQQQQPPAIVLEFLKEEQEMKRLIRTPTPDGLALIDDVKEEDKVAVLSGSSVQSLPPIPFVDEQELLDVLADPVLNEELDNLFAEEHQQVEAVEEIPLAEVKEPICIEDEITIAANEVAKESEHESEHESEANDSDLEMAMEALFLEEPQSASLFDSTMDSGDMTPNTLAMRLPMRCKTRVTEMATWFEKQMTTPEHNETFQQEEAIPLN